MLEKDFTEALYTDSKSLYDSIVEISSTTEQPLLIDLTIVCKLYKLRGTSNVVWILFRDNPADTLTKFFLSSVLVNLMVENKLSIFAKFWVERAWIWFVGCSLRTVETLYSWMRQLLGTYVLDMGI